MPVSSSHFYVVVFALAVCLGTAPASAELIFGDNFETYTTGDLNGQNGAMSGATGTWGAAYTANAVIDVVAGGLAYSNGAISIDGGTQHAVINNFNADSLLSRPFTSQSGTIYFSFLFRPVSGVSSDEFVQFMMNNDTASATSAAVIMRDHFEARGTAASGSPPSPDSPVVPVAGTTYLLVGKVSKVASTNYNRVELFVNPSSLTETSADATATTNIGVGSLGFFTVRTANLAAGDMYQFDALRVGTTWGDVVSPRSTTRLCRSRRRCC
jgi:hypothetical protein